MELEKIKLNLKGVIGSSKDGILVSNLESEYQKITNSSLNYKQYNQSLIGFLNSMSDMVRLQYTNCGCYVHLSTNENAPQCLKKLCNLIQTTKTKKSVKKKHNIPNNIMSKTNGYSNLKISVPNDLWATNHETNGNGFDARNNTNNSAFLGFNANNASHSRINNSYNQNDNFKSPSYGNSSANKILHEQSLNSSNMQSGQSNYQNVNSTPVYPSLSSCSQASNKFPNEKSFVTDNSSSQSNGFNSADIVNSHANKTPNEQSFNSSYNRQPKQNTHQNVNNTPVYPSMTSYAPVSNKLSNEKSFVTDNSSSQSNGFNSAEIVNSHANKTPNEQSFNSSYNRQLKQNTHQNVNSAPVYPSPSSCSQASNKFPNEKSFVTDNSSSQSNGFNSADIVNSHANKTPNEQSFNSSYSSYKQNTSQNVNITPVYPSKPSYAPVSNKLSNDKSRVTDNKIIANESFQSHPKPYSISSSSTNSLDIISNKSFSNIDVSVQNETISAINMIKGESFIIDWPINLDISIDILHKPVRILGIQSGYALLSIGTPLSKSVYIPADTIYSMFPGDIFLWQPPIPDPNRLKSMIDISNAVPIIAIEQTNDTMKVRVMGLKVLLIVHIHDVYKFPNNISNFKKFLSEFEVRKLTFTRLAMIPKIVNYYNTDLLSGLYFSPDSLNDNEFIFERCEKRGVFLNVLLIRYLYSDLRKMNSNDQKLFLGNIHSVLDTAKSDLSSHFRDMLAGKSVKSPECDMLLPIEHNRTHIINRMLIGCEKIFSAHYATSENELKLERMGYNDRNNGFYYFENNFQATVAPQNSQLRGIYRINDEFVSSRLSNITRLRIQCALLIHIPSVSKFSNLSIKI